MTLEQIVCGLIIGSLTTLLVNWLELEVKMKLLEAIGIGIIGAWIGEMMLSPLLAGTLVDYPLWYAFIGALSAEAILFGIKSGWNEIQQLRQPRAWSYVQPFEE